MKTLLIIRHAKSAWDNPSLNDFDRPLNIRGKADAPHMGKVLKDKNIVADKWLTSPAKRALATAVRFAKAMEMAKSVVQTDQRIYHGSVYVLMQIIKEQSSDVDTLFLFGHNPGLTDLANMLTTARIDNIPTCGIFAVSFPVSQWHEVDGKNGDFLFFDYPKRYV